MDNDRRDAIAEEYSTKFEVTLAAAIDILFSNKKSMRLTYNGYEYLKELYPSARIELVAPLTTRQILYLARYIPEPYMLIERGRGNPVLHMFDEKIAAYIMLAGNDLERFVNSKKLSVD